MKLVKKAANQVATTSQTQVQGVNNNAIDRRTFLQSLQSGRGRCRGGC